MTFSEEFKAIASENYELETRRTKNDKWTFLHSRSIRFPIYGMKLKLIQSHFLPTSECIESSIRPLIEGFRALVSQKDEL